MTYISKSVILFMHSAKEDIIFNKISKKLKKVLTYVERSDILSEYFWGKASMKSKISRKIQKMLDFVKYIWYIGSTAEKWYEWSLKTEQNVNS